MHVIHWLPGIAQRHGLGRRRWPPAAVRIQSRKQTDRRHVKRTCIGNNLEVAKKPEESTPARPPCHSIVASHNIQTRPFKATCAEPCKKIKELFVVFPPSLAPYAFHAPMLPALLRPL